jgi:LmbE family N-acetylglucosaminyl deacetylase
VEPLRIDDIERILVVTAHPDDVDFGFAGSVAAWTDKGIEVEYCIVTDGDAGGSEYGVARGEMAALRREEQRAAAAVVGVSQVHFLGYPDGRVESGLALRHDLSRVIRRFRPQRVVTQSPERNWQRVYVSHPDHMAVGAAALAAVYPDARNRWAHPELLDEGLEPHAVGEVWVGGGTPAPTHYQDVTATIDRKIAALQCHASQLPDPAATAEMVRGWTSFNARLAGLPDGSHAEAVFVLDTR